MKTYATFDEWKKDQTRSAQMLITPLRKMVNRKFPKLTETVKWGNGVWTGKEWPLLYIFVMERGVQLGFFGGSEVSDPKKMLQGKGKYVRFIPIYSKKDINERYFTALIKCAVILQK